MKFYVDFDDCLCETARAFTDIAFRLFGITVPYEDLQFFNLQDSFKLSDKEYEELMIEGHRPEVLLSYEETPLASEVLNEFMDNGHEISIITGRPFSTFEVSRAWLDGHGLSRAALYFFDKYGRDAFIKHGSFNLTSKDYYRMQFDHAIEDSPMAFRFFDHLPTLNVMVYNRPWNINSELPGSNYHRCSDWGSIRKQVLLSSADPQRTGN